MSTLSEKCQYDPQERVRTIAARLFKTRPRAEVILRPYMKNAALHVDKQFWTSSEHVDLWKVLPEAKEGQVCFASFCISSATEDDGYLNISSDVDVYLDGKKVHDHGDCADEYVGF